MQTIVFIYPFESSLVVVSKKRTIHYFTKAKRKGERRVLRKVAKKVGKK
jgi:hypothetical protein